MKASYRHSDNIEWKQFDEESVLLNTATGAYFRLNRVGSFIWPLLDGDLDQEEIVRKVIRYFDVSAARARQDVTAFVEELLAEKLITPVSE